MNIVVLTAAEPLYLPAFFARFLAVRARDTRAIYLAPPRYGKESVLDTARKYRRAFGWTNLARLGARTLAAKLRDRLGAGQRSGRFYSIAAVARHYDVPCETVDDVNDPRFLERLQSVPTDLVVSVSCPQLFKRNLIHLPPRGCLNVHGALLPRYRGIAPSFWMMRHGESEAGVTVFLVNEDIDLGDVVEQQAFPILPNETLDRFIVRSKAIACDALLRAIDKIEAGAPATRPLTREGGSYFSFPTRADYRAFRARGRRLW